MQVSQSVVSLLVEQKAGSWDGRRLFRKLNKALISNFKREGRAVLFVWLFVAIFANLDDDLLAGEDQLVV